MLDLVISLGKLITILYKTVEFIFFSYHKVSKKMYLIHYRYCITVVSEVNPSDKGATKVRKNDFHNKGNLDFTIRISKHITYTIS